MLAFIIQISPNFISEGIERQNLSIEDLLLLVLRIK
jgi:hypothetical protein